MSAIDFILIREQVIKSVRRFFDEQGFHEVITPVLNDSVPLEPNLYPFSTEWKTNDGTKKLFLTISPEKNLKRMLALGLGNCYSIGASFRNLEGAGSLHTPEFLMLEWYRKNAEYTHIMKEVQDLILYVKNDIDTYLHQSLSPILVYQNEHVDFTREWPKISVSKLLEKLAKRNINEILSGDAILIQYARNKGYAVEGATWNEIYDQIFVNEIESQLPKSPFFLVDFPARLSTLCKKKAENPLIAERFELYMFGIELGNGNTESTDVEGIRKIFEHEKKLREKMETVQAVDEDFLESLAAMHGTSYAGIGLGLDRLSMIMANQDELMVNYK